MTENYPYISNLGGHIIIGPECFSDPTESVICWKGENYYSRRTITTATELAALEEVGGTVRAEDGWIFQALAGGWISPGESRRYVDSQHLHHVFGPTFTVIWEPTK